MLAPGQPAFSKALIGCPGEQAPGGASVAAKTRTARAAVEKAAEKPEARKPSALERTIDSLTLALERAFDMAPEDATAVAETVAGHFDGRREVRDDDIAADVRSLFYTLEARRILSFRREEYETDDGQKRRAFWWRLRGDEVARLCAPAARARDEDVYTSLPAECWRRAMA